MKRRYSSALSVLVLAACLIGGRCQGKTTPPPQPNLVVIFIDDMGYGDIGPFGSTQNQTPQLDRMAEEGMRLTSFYVASPVCTPSRAALMTGSYPKRVGLAKGSWGIVLFPKDPHGLNASEKTIAEVLKDAGYATGCFGKWHLGDQPEFLPTRHGFDTYYGIPYSNDMWPPHPPSTRWKNGVCPLPILRGEKVVGIVKDMDEQADLCRQFTEEAVAFIRKNASAGSAQARPFFCYVPHAFIHYPRKARPEFMEKATAKGTKKLLEAQIEEVDWSTGEILKAIRELGIEKKTLVLFTSDNGPAGGSAGPLRGHKGQVWEGGMREPAVAWWPGTVPAGSTCDELCTTMDLLPTFAALGGGTVPNDRVIDGKDITSLLLGKPGAKTPHDAFYYFRVDRLEAVRSGAWKLHARGQLYNLDDDIGESRDVAKQNPDVVARLKGLMETFSADLAETSRPVGKVAKPVYLVPAETAKPGKPDVSKGSVFEDFEGKTYGEWKAEGKAFGTGPAKGTLPRQQRVSGMQGKGMVNTFLGQDKSTGALTSPDFTIKTDYITFLIGGGQHRNTALELLVGGRPVRHATGRNSEAMQVDMLDVRDLRGKAARLRIIDHNTGGWGHVLVDHITFSNERPPSIPTAQTRQIAIKGRYLLLPIYRHGAKGSKKGQLEIRVDGRLVHRMAVHLADQSEDISFWASIPMQDCVGKTAAITYPVSDASKALELIASGDTHRNLLPLYDEPLRPQLRFSQARGWNNDPNGMVYYDGEYHLFFQSNPVATYHDNMYWGHAVSKDLVHWKELPAALRPLGNNDSDRHPSMAKGKCFSGGGSVDFNNTLGLQKGDTKTLIATFTDTSVGESVAYSTDKGRTWHYHHAINPIIKHGGRDPKPLWHEPSKHWVIAVFDGQKERGGQNISFYRSKDFKTWEYTSHVKGYFECPEFFELPIGGDEKNRRWVLMGANAQYQVGTFDGKAFKPEHENKKETIVGRIFSAIYAGQCFSNTPDGRVVYIGWAGMGRPGDSSSPFHHGFTLPLELSLRTTADGVRLFAKPVDEINQLRDETLLDVHGKKLGPGSPKLAVAAAGQEYDILLKLKSTKRDGKAELRIGETLIPIDLTWDDPAWRFAPSSADVGEAVLRVIVDRPFMEVCGGNGRRYRMINRADRGKAVGEISLVRTAGVVDIEAFTVCRVKSIWTGEVRKMAAIDTGLAPEVTDLNAAAVSYTKEKEIEYLEKPYITTAPADLGDGIPVGKLGVDGGNGELVLAFANELAGYTDDQHLTDSLLISYKGKLLFESYYRRGRQNYPHYQMSITKSYTALALGRAIQWGHFSMDDLHKPVVDFLKKVDRSKVVAGADRITLDNAMHMGSGIRIDGQKVKELMKTPSKLKGQGQVRAYLEHSAPIPQKGIKFKYQASDPALAMQVVEAIVPGSAETFIRSELLEKMGITNYGWQRDLSGLPKSAAGSSVRSRDMLKIGMMLMAGGKWQGEQLIPEAFVTRALSPLAHSYGTSHYGYFWWIDDFKVGDKSYHCPAGRGAGGQFILMFPELELIVVITAHNKGMGTMLQDAPKRIIPAFTGK